MKKIVISGGIGYEITPNSIRAQLPDNGDDIEVNIASPGGFVFEGLEIFNMFRDYKRNNPGAQMMLTIKGLSASMATYLSVCDAFDLIAAEDNAVFMIHNPYNGTIGDYREMQKNAEFLKGLSDLLNNAYAKKTGMSKKEITKMMDEETWLFGEEIKTAGFVDEIIKSEEKIEKETALSEMKVKMSLLNEKINNRKFDFNKAAAIINSLPPASTAGKNIMEVKPMNFDELMAANPAAKIEYDNKIIAAKEAGKKEALEIAAKAAIFAGSKEYPEQIRNAALEVMQGKKKH